MATMTCRSKGQSTLSGPRQTLRRIEFLRIRTERVRQFKVNAIRRTLFDNRYPLEQREEAILDRLIAELTQSDNGSD